MAKKTVEKKIMQKTTRPPIVVVMGHIDHGKTSLLDYIRKSRVAEKESGGITQHIGAYEAEHHGKKITFIDTPGHEAFSKMRVRGANIADIAILVVAADEGVKPQTKEAITTIQSAGIPYVVVINKIDKPNAEPERVKKELADNNVLIEGWGGKVPVVEISAKTGKNIDELLETILLVAEIENLEDDLSSSAEGVVIESHQDVRRGPTATILFHKGRMTKKDLLAIGGSIETLKIFENFLGKPITEARSSMPVIASSLLALPHVGDLVKSFTNRADVEAWVEEQKKDLPVSQEVLQAASQVWPREEKKEETAHVQETASGEERVVVEKEAAAEAPQRLVLNLVLKTDVSGSEEAIVPMIEAMQYQLIGARVLKSEVGDVNEADVRMASVSSNTVILGFKVKISPLVRQLAERQNVAIIHEDIIYKLADRLKEVMEQMLPAEVKIIPLGKAKILAFFKREHDKQIVGGKVTSGKIKRGARCNVLRGNREIGKGAVQDLQSQKKAVSEVPEGSEFGMLTDVRPQIQAGDALEIYEEERIKQKLA